MSAVVASLSCNIMDDLPPFLNTSVFFNNEYVLLLWREKANHSQRCNCFGDSLVNWEGLQNLHQQHKDCFEQVYQRDYKIG